MLKKKLFMLNKFLNDIKKTKETYNLATDLKSKTLGEYYFVFEEKRVSKGKDQALIKKFDENGIPLNKTYIDVTDKEFVYFPISIGQMGLSVFHTYLETKSDEDKERFMKFVDWYFINAEVTEKLGARWLTDVKLPQYRNPGPWQSAFSQSRAISILLRGYQITGEEKYAKLAEQALISFTIPASEGGVTSFTKWGPFYEEYTSSIPTLVLNGKIFALCGVYDFVRVFPENNTAKKIFDEGIETLTKIIPEYDLGFWSRYNLCEADWLPKIDPSSKGYQLLHINQLNMLYQLTGHEIFKKYADIFKSQISTTNILRGYLLKYKSLKKIGRV